MAKAKRESSGGSGLLILAAVGLFVYSQVHNVDKPVVPAPSPAPTVVDAKYADLAAPIVTALQTNPAKRAILSGFFTDYARVLAADGKVLQTTEQFRRVNSSAINVRLSLSPEASGAPSVG